MDSATGLRERKKARTRQLISGVATRLFVERGFEAVTVAEVARAAEVAENTVFNYFPTKEDLFFDRAADVEDWYSGVVRERRTGESVVDALRRDFMQRLDASDDSLGLSLGSATFWGVVDASPALQARLLSIGQRATERLTQTLAAEVGLPGDDALMWTLANMLLGVPWALQTEIRRRLRLGDSPAGIVAALKPIASEAFDLLERGLGGYGTRT